MVDFGLSQSDMQAILKVLKEYPAVKEAIIFGSRAKGNHRQGSDIDIALKGTGIDAAEIACRLNDTIPLPYFFDVLDYDLVESNELKSHIDRVGKVFFSRGS